jgi:hypothetical protein
MKIVAAEQMPMIVTSEGPRLASPGKGEIVTDKVLEQTRTQSRALSSHGTGLLPTAKMMRQRLRGRKEPLNVSSSRDLFDHGTDVSFEGNSVKPERS